MIALEPLAKPIERTPATTNIQVEVDRGTGRLEHYQPDRVTFEVLRKMRRDPTIALARAISAAPVISAEWAVEGEVESHVEFIKEQLLPRRLDLMTSAVYGYIDFGWKAYEKVYKNDEWDDRPVYALDKLKALKNDFTWALYNLKGDFAGFENDDIYVADTIIIDAEHTLFLNQEDERLGQYADPLLLAAHSAWLNAIDANAAAARYDNKIAGEHWVVHYPVGRTEASFLQAGPDGRVSNDEIAAAILKQLCASGSVTIPVYTENILAEVSANSTNPTGWQIELLSSSGQQSSFVDRLKYLDTLKVRALLLPERAVLEGQFGTKAEAETHADAAITTREIWHEFFTQELNRQVVEELLAINFGRRDSARLVAVPLHDDKRMFYEKLFSELIAHPEASGEILDGVDFGELREILDVPLDTDSEEANAEVTI